jgi:CspA family cold shock protein
MTTLPSSDRIVNADGVVKWFDPKKGFGFVIGPEGQDIFVHYTKITGDGFRVLKDGSHVSYDAEKTDKGWHASRVTRTETAEGLPPRARGRRTYSRTPRR